MPTTIRLHDRVFLPSPWAGQWEVTADHGVMVVLTHVSDPRRRTELLARRTVEKIGQRVGSAGEPKGAA